MTDIATLFQTDPLKLTKADITEIIKHYRLASANFANGDKAAGNAKKIPGTKPVKEKSINLDDILD